MKVLFTSLGLLLLSSLSAQQTIRPNFDTISVIFDLWETPYVHFDFATDTTREDYSPLYTGSWLSFSGHAKQATVFHESRIGTRAKDTSRYERFTSSFSPTPAISSILQDAAGHEITIINEAHHEPRHRVFTRKLLQGLYDAGYRHFGLETLAGSPIVDSTLHAGRYLSMNQGYYIRDPQFAAMITEAVSIGFHVFGYDKAGTGSPKLRELGQMRNIMNYRAEHPEGKLLLHVGYSHAKEGELGGRWEKAMAQRLADTTHLDPLTIDQTKFREMASLDKEQFEYKDHPLENAAVFVDKEGEHFNFDNKVNWFDRYVFHPRTKYIHGRPDYVFAFKQKPVFIDFSTIKQAGPYLLQAYSVEDDMTKAVPRDVVETTGKDGIALALNTGKYQLLVTLPNGAQFWGKLEVVDGK